MVFTSMCPNFNAAINLYPYGNAFILHECLHLDTFFIQPTKQQRSHSDTHVQTPLTYNRLAWDGPCETPELCITHTIALVGVSTIAHEVILSVAQPRQQCRDHGHDRAVLTAIKLLASGG